MSDASEEARAEAMAEEMLRVHDASDMPTRKRPPAGQWDDHETKQKSFVEDLADTRPTTQNVRRSEQCNELFAALAKAQAELGAVEFTRNKTVHVKTQAGSYDFSYCTFDEILSKALPITGKHGLSVIQSVTEKHVVTTIGHASGQWWEAVIELPTVFFKPQEYGSAITYRKRYAFCSLFCIHADEDDDANIESGNTYQGKERPKAAAAPRTTTPPADKIVGMHGLTYLEWEKQQPANGPKLATYKALQLLAKDKRVRDAITETLAKTGQQFVWQLDAAHADELYETAKSLAGSK